MSWAHFIQTKVSERGSAIYLVDASSGREITYREFWNSAVAVGEFITDRGVKKGERVALVFRSGVEFVFAYFACLCAGVVAVPINPNASGKDIKIVLSLSKPSLVIMGKEKGKIFDKLVEECLSVYPICNFEAELFSGFCERRNNLDFCEFADEQLWTIHFTSGTTGVPKGVCHTVSSLLSSACAFSDKLGFTAEDRMYHVLPMFYMAGFLNTLLCPFVSGGSVVIGSPFGVSSALNFWKFPRKFLVNTLWLVPTMLVSLLKMDRRKEDHQWARENIRLVCVGTAPLPITTKHDFEEKYGVPVLQSYGLSETLFVASNTLSLPSSDKSIGSIIPGTDVRICDEQGREIKPELGGEIWIRGDGMMLGYWNASTLIPEEALINGWFPSGDIGKLNKKSELFVTDRKKDIIIKGGENISAEKVSEVLRTHPQIDDAVVVGIVNEFYGEEVAAALTLSNENDKKIPLSALLQSIQEHCARFLSPSAIPTKIIKLAEFPRGNTGKILKAEIKALFINNP